MSDQFLPDEFYSLVSQVGSQAVANVDQQFAAQRSFAEEQRAKAGDKGVPLSALLRLDEQTEQERLAQVDAEIAKIDKEAAAAVKAKENADAGSDEKFPAPPITE